MGEGGTRKGGDKPATWGDLARAVGRNPSQVTRWRRKPWWPADVTPADVDRVRALVAKHVTPAQRRPAAPLAPKGERAPAATPSPGTAPAAEGARELTPEDQRLIDRLRSSDAAPVQVARSMLLLTARRVAAEVEAGTAAASDLDSVSKSLGALRQAEGAYLELERRRGELVPREEARAVVAAVARRLVQELDALVAMLPAEVSVWRGSPELADETACQQAVRAWAERRTHALRLALAEELSALSPGDLEL